MFSFITRLKVIISQSKQRLGDYRTHGPCMAR